MNRIEISGRIVDEPSFHTNSETDVHVGVFTLCIGQEVEVVPVAAIRNAATELSQFQNGDFVSVEGRLAWRRGKMEILAESIRQWTNGVHRKTAQQDKFPRQIKGMRGVSLR